MPARTNIVINDGESTPVAHTFVPMGTLNGVHMWKESDGVPIGDNLLGLSLKKTDTVYRARVTLAMPVTVTETVNGVDRPVVDRIGRFNGEFIFPASSSLQERKNISELVRNMFANASIFQEVVWDLEDVY